MTAWAITPIPWMNAKTMISERRLARDTARNAKMTKMVRTKVSVRFPNSMSW